MMTCSRTGLRACGWCCIAFACTCIRVTAQTSPQSDSDQEDFVRQLFPVPSDEGAAEKYEALFQSLSQTMDLNQVTRDELAACSMLSLSQLSAFFAYRRDHGPFLSIYELQAVPEFDIDTIRKLLPFITLGATGKGVIKALVSPTQHYLLFRTERQLELQKGFHSIDTSQHSALRYEGRPWQWYGRFRFSRPGQYSFGITSEKDAGEKVKWEPSKHLLGGDFTSFHAQIQNRGRLKNVTLGDFQMQVGQGLVMASGFSFGKGGEVITSVSRPTLGLRPYTSVMEAGYFRGVGGTVEVASGLTITTFVSATRRDATTDSSNEESATSLSVAGLHRTANERMRQANLGEQNLGMHLLLKGRRGFRVGWSGLHTRFSTMLQKRPSPYNFFEFSGRRNLVMGLHGDTHWKNFHVSGEVAMSGSKGVAGIASVVAALTKVIDVSFLVRKYAANFHSFYGNAFGEGARPINENGIYWGVRFVPNKKWSMGAYYDSFTFPWLKYLVNAPSSGFGGLGYLRWNPRRKTALSIVVTMEQKEKNEAANLQPMTPLVTTVKNTCQFNFEHEKPLKYSMRTRLQGTIFSNSTSGTNHGFAVAQNLTLRFEKLDLSGSVSFFNTESYDSRQFLYEKDVMYAFSLPSFQGKGLRYYLISRFQVQKNIKLWLRWAQSQYMDKDTIGSGLDEIAGSRKSELKAQIIYQF